MPSDRVAFFLCRLSLLACSVAAFACGASGADGLPSAPGSDSGSTCPSDSALTYDNFGREFMRTYCTRCHASTLSGGARQGAPSDHDFDDLAGIRQMADHIDEHAAAGPGGVNQSMPPNGAQPTREEREELGQWLACGSPS
jgi:cytochrome c5